MLANEAIGHVESDIDELSDQMNEMTRRMLRIEEERQASFFSKVSGKISGGFLHMKFSPKASFFTALSG